MASSYEPESGPVLSTSSAFRTLRWSSFSSECLVACVSLRASRTKVRMVDVHDLPGICRQAAAMFL